MGPPQGYTATAIALASAGITGTLPVANGGTASSTAAAARDALGAAATAHTHAGADIVSGTVADARLSSNVTVQGNTFGGASQLLKLDGAGGLPALATQAAAKANLTDGTGGAVDGTLVDVTTLAVADPTKVNANFADVADRINAILAVLRTHKLQAS